MVMCRWPEQAKHLHAVHVELHYADRVLLNEMPRVLGDHRLAPLARRQALGQQVDDAVAVVLRVDRADERAVAAADEVIDEPLTPEDADALDRIGVALLGGGIGDEDDAAAGV